MINMAFGTTMIYNCICGRQFGTLDSLIYHCLEEGDTKHQEFIIDLGKKLHRDLTRVFLDVEDALKGCRNESRKVEG